MRTLRAMFDSCDFVFDGAGCLTTLLGGPLRLLVLLYSGVSFSLGYNLSWTVNCLFLSRLVEPTEPFGSIDFLPLRPNPKESGGSKEDSLLPTVSIGSLESLECDGARGLEVGARDEDLISSSRVDILLVPSRGGSLDGT